MPHQQLVLIDMEQADLPTLQDWFGDAELSRRLSGMLPLQKYFSYVQSEPNYYAWMALEGAVSVGAAFLQVEPDDPQSFTFLVNPSLRSQGYGRLIVQGLMARPEVAEVKEWRVGIEADNLASQRCLASVGFVLDDPTEDEDGFLQYTFIRR